MSYLIWAIINVSLAILILYFLYRCAKLIYSTYGKGATIIFILILISILNFSATKKTDKEQVWNFKTEEGVRYFQQDYTEILDDNLLFKIKLNVISLNEKDRKHESPIKAFSSVSGIVGYNTWTPKNIAIRSAENNFEYTVTGEMSWKLLNYTIYKEQKIYKRQLKKV